MPFVSLNKNAVTAMTVLAMMVTGCGDDPAAEADDLSWIDEMPLTALVTPCSVASGTGFATITLAAGGESVLVSLRADSAILVNGEVCALAGVMKKLTITGGTGADTVIIDFLNGTFLAGSTTTANIIIDMVAGSGTNDAFKLRGRNSATTGDVLTFGAGTGGVVAVNFAADLNKDITVANADTFAVATGNGIDTVTGAGGAGTGAAFTAALSINGGALVDTLTGGDGADTISGGAGNDIISGGLGADTLNGDADADTFNEGAVTNGADTFNGGTGTDTVSYALRTAIVTVTIAASGGTGDDGESTETDDVIDDVEVVTGGTLADTMTCQASGCTLNGGAGDDILTGAAGADTLNGDAGNDTLTGAAGADTLNGGVGDDTFVEGTAASGGDVFNGGAGTDTVDYSGRTVALTVTMDGVIADDGESGELDDVNVDVEDLLGGTVADVITGNLNNNVITGGTGNDTLSGGAGDDTFRERAVTSGADSFDGGAGVDTVDYSARVAALTVTMDGVAADDGLSGETDNVSATVENLLGGTAADTITGNLLDNNIDGGAGADTIVGGAGDDILDGAGGTDSVTGGDGDDICIGETLVTCEL